MFINLAGDLLGIGPFDGTTRQVSSYGRRSRLFPGVVGEFQKKCVDIRPGELFTMADIEGPGLITRIWVTVPRRSNPGVLRNLVISAYWDGEEQPSVLTPLGDLFGATFSLPRDYTSAYLSITSGAYVCLMPMPFGRRAVITAFNESKLTVRLFFYQVTYLELERELPEGTPRFHCRWHRELLERGDPPYTVLEAEGKGVYLGCHMNMRGRGCPWRLNPVNAQMPEGFGLGLLEGWERMWIDGAKEPDVHGTGGEDYFNGAWYFTRVPSVSPTHGVTMRERFSRRVSCYRYHVEMPVSFRTGIRVTLDHGLNNLLPAEFDGTAYWYQSEPHLPFGETAPARDRRPRGAHANRLIMAAPLLPAAAVAAALRKRRVRRSAASGLETDRAPGDSGPACTPRS